ncbi:MAG: NADH-quinone oxidoreductase subunit D [Cytophagales bacterium]|nr:MAG: NADH-quinone oxidoreductase subunit D [Cytophagales bacterium]TAF61308.1 MAG: NADH-quinone oxidoreductase subunit D [Cytophagales bacterium]
MPLKPTFEQTQAYLNASEPTFYKAQELAYEEMLINLGPQHPSTHGVLRLEVLLDGELVKDVVPHIGYLHRCFEKHAEKLTFQQIIPYVDRMDYAASMNSTHIYAMAVEKLLGIEGNIAPRVEFIRVLVAELNRIASHLLALGTFANDLGAVTAFLWAMRDREHILRMLEWLTGARQLYNYIWVGGLYYDLPLGFEERCLELVHYLPPKLREFETLVLENPIFMKRTQGLSALKLAEAINLGVTGPMLRACGLAYDLRRIEAYSVYPELDFAVPTAQNGDCYDRSRVRFLEALESLHIVKQCAEILQKKHPRSRDFDPQAACVRKPRPMQTDLYFRGESPKGELGFYIRTLANKSIPDRIKVRPPSFCNLSALPFMCKNIYLADLIAVVGSLDIVLGEVDR